MRESIGGGWMISIAVVFLVFFSTFLAVSINYTKAFKVKNQIINIIEEMEGYTTTSPDKIPKYSTGSIDEIDDIGTTEARIKALMLSIGYKEDMEINCNEDQGTVPENLSAFCLKKVCAEVKINTTTQQRAKYYRVTTFINFEIPVIGININIPISGETTTLYYVNGTDDYKCN